MDIRGLKLLGEMSKAELIEEIMSYQMSALNEQEEAQLKAIIIDYRVDATRKRLESEAAITIHRSLFHTHVEDNDE